MAKQLNVNLAFNADVGKAKASVQELQSLLNKVATTSTTASGTGSMAQQLQAASSAAKELQIHLNNAFNAKTGQFDLSALDKSLRASGSNIQDLSIKLINAGETGQQAFMKLAQSISMADQPMLRVNSKLREFATTMKNTVRWQLSSSMLHGFIGAIQSAYGYAQDLNESLTNIRIVTGQSTEEMALFAEKANKAAKALNTTTTDYTNASLIYFQQGLSEEEVLARTEVTIKMANVTSQSAQTVSDQLTAIWNNFYDGSKSLEYYADVMTALGAATASSTDEIAGGLEKFAAIGNTIGLSYEYAAAALATITANTRQSEDVVGTALKTIFARIQGLNLGETLDDGVTLNKYSEALQKVGISIFDSNGELKKMDSILDEMGSKWETLSKAQQVALAQTVAGVRQYNQLISLMDNWNAGDSDSMMANLDTAYGASGTLNEQSDAYAESWEAASKRVKAAAEGIYQSLLDDKFFIWFNNGIAEVLGGVDLFIDKAGGLKSVLIGVSSILLATYSSKIPLALQNISHNFGIIKNNLLAMTDLSGKLKIPDQYADTLQKMQKATDHMFNVQGVDKNSSLGFMVTSSNELAVARSKLSSVSDKMTESEKQLANLELQMAQSYQEEIYALKQKNEELEKSIKLQTEALQSENPGAGFTSKAYKQEEAMANRYTAMQRDPDALAGDQNALGEFKRSYSSVIDEIDTSIGEIGNKLLTEFMKAGDGIEAESQSISGELDKVAAAAQTIQKNLRDLTLEEGKKEVAALRDTIPEAVREASGLEKVFRDITAATTKEDFDKGVDDLVNSLRNCEIPASKIKQVLKGLYGDSKIDKLSKDMKELKSNTEQAEKKMSQLKNALSGFTPTHVVRTSEALGSLASLAGGAVTMVNLLSSAIRSLADPDATGWEKLSAVLMVIATGIPTVTMGFRSVGTLLTYLNQQFATLGIVTATSTQAHRASALAAQLSALNHGQLLRTLTAEQIAQVASIAMTEKENGATREEIALKIQEHLVTNNIVKGKAAEVIGRLAAKKAVDQENMSIRQGLIAKGLDSAAMMIQNGHRTAGIILQTILNALTGDWVSILKVVLVVIGLLVGGAFIAWLDKIIVTEKEAMKALEDNAKESKQAFEDVKNAIQETADALKSIEDQRSALDNMTAGTVEWYEAVAKLNAEVLSLVEKFPFLKDYVVQTDGVLKITEEGLKQLEEYNNKRYMAANNLMISDKIAYEQAKVDSNVDDMWYNDYEYIHTMNTGRAMVDAYKNPMIGDQLFTEEGAGAVFDSFLNHELENTDYSNSLLSFGGYYTAQQVKDDPALYEEYKEKFYQDLLKNKDTIVNSGDTEKYLQELENSQMSNTLKMIGSNRSVEEANQLMGADYSEIRDAKKADVKKSFGDWNDYIDYDENDAEWGMIEDFMKTKGDNVKYVAQKGGKMVLEVDGKEVEYSAEQVYNGLAELYTSDEIKTRLCGALTETLGSALVGVDLSQLDTSQIFQLDNLVMDFENALAESGLEDQASTIMNKIIAANGGDTEGLENFLNTMSNIDLQGNAQNLREFNGAALQLAEGKITVEEFTHAMEKMSAAAQLDSMGSYFSGMAEKFGMSEEDAQGMQDYAKHIMEIAESSDAFSDELATNADSAAEMAVEITRMNRGVDKLAKGFKDWNDVLSKSSRESKEYAEALSGMKDALADILDVNKDLLSEDFVTENLPLIEKAAEGSAEAIDALTAKLDEEIILNITAGQTEQFINDVTAANNALQGMEWPDIEVGAILDDQQFLDAANELVNTAGMTADEANAYFAGIGYEPVYNEEELPTDTNIPNGTTKMSVQNIGWNTASMDILGMSLPIKMPNITYTTESVPLDPTSAEGSMRLVSFSGDGKAPPIRGLRKKAPGSANNYSKQNSGGPAPGGNSGGGGKDDKPKTTKASPATKKNEVVERYKEINDKLDDAQRKMDKASKEADRLWGPARLKQMQAVNAALEEEVGLLDQKIAEAEGYLADDRAELESLLPGISIDPSSGNIINYDEIMGDLYSQLETAEKNAGDEWTDEEKEGIEKIKERIEMVKNAIDQYDESRETLQDLEDEQLEKIYQWQDNNYEMLNYELEIDLQINEKKMEYVEYYLGKLEDDSYATAEAYAYVSQQAGLYTDNLKQQSDYLTKLEQDYYAGRISLDAYKEGLADSQGAIIDNLEALTEMKKAMRDYYGDALAKSMEEVSIYTERMEKLNSTLDHYSNIMELVGAKEDTATKGKILDAKAKNLQNEMQTQKKLYEASQAEAQKFKDLMDKAAAGSNEYEMYKANWLAAQEIADEAQENMLSKTEEWAEAMSAVVENELAGFAKTLEESLTGGTSFDELLTSMDRASSLQEEYLTTTNQIYETNKLMRTAQQEIDKTTNSVAKKKLQGFITETAALQDKNKLSQYELDIQQAKYDLLVAEIALEEAQKAKSSVRLSRDSEGNFGYVYTADNSAVSEAEQNLADAQNKLYNIGLDGANDYSQKYAQTLQESQDAITELTMQWKNGEIASEEEFNKRKQEIMEYYGKKIEQYSDLHSIALTTDTNVVRDAWSSDFSDMISKAGEWDDAVNQYFTDAAGSMQKWTETCNTVLSESGLDDLDSKVEAITTESDKLKETLLGKDGDSGVVGAFRDQAEVAGEVSKSYVEVQNSIDGVIASYEALLKTVNGSYVDPNTPVIDPALQNTQTSVSVNNTGTPTSGIGSGGGGGAGRAVGGGYGSGGNGGAIAAVQDAAKLAAENAKRLADAELAQKAAAASGGTAKASGGRGGGSYQSSDLADSIEAEIAEMVKRLELQKKELEYQKLINDAITVQKDVMAIGGGGKGGSAYDKYELLYEQELEMLKHQEDMQLRMQDNALINTDILTRILEVLEMHTMNAQLGGMLASPGVIGQPEQLLEQSVVIEAHFPDATNSSEIEEAFNSLINRASQYANRT